MNNNRAFTLLEVLISLTIISIIAVIAVQQVGQQQESIAQNAWQDNIVYKGRETLLNVIQSKNYEQSGTLAPDFPSISWKSQIKTLSEDYQLHVISITFKDENRKPAQTFVMEYILP